LDGTVLPDDGADRIDEKARGGQGRQAVKVCGRIKLDKVESRDPGPLADARDQIDHLRIGEAAGRTRPPRPGSSRVIALKRLVPHDCCADGTCAHRAVRPEIVPYTIRMVRGFGSPCRILYTDIYP
jgi:hypothetical protein